MSAHDHVHGAEKTLNLTPWILFALFVLGPCEPLIPVLMVPAMENNAVGLVLVISVFALVTIAAMLFMVIFLSYGYNLINLRGVEKYAHAIAGFIILMSGLGMVILGL